MGLREIATNRMNVGNPHRRETLAILRNFPDFCDPGRSDCVLDFGCGIDCPAGLARMEAWPEVTAIFARFDVISAQPKTHPRRTEQRTTIFHDVRPSLFP